MMSRDTVIDYIRERESNIKNISAKHSLFIMRFLLESKPDYSMVHFKSLIAKALKIMDEKGSSTPAVRGVYEDVIEFIGSDYV